jgi:hypothetical protein
MNDRRAAMAGHARAGGVDEMESQRAMGSSVHAQSPRRASDAQILDGGTVWRGVCLVPESISLRARAMQGNRRSVAACRRSILSGRREPA